MQLLAKIMLNVLLALIPLIGVLWLADLPLLLEMPIVTAAYLSLLTGLAVAAGFIMVPYGKEPGAIDLLLALAGFAAWAWGGWHHEQWLVDFSGNGPHKWLPGATGLVLLIEALRKTCGLPITIVAIVTGIYAFVGHVLPGAMEAAYTPADRAIMYLYSDTNGVPGIVLGVVASVVLGFIVLGAVMGEVGASQFFTNFAMALMGDRRGGPAKVAVVASSLFGSISGSTVANIMTTGVVTIPLMKRSGFPPHYAGAVEAVASNGGQLAPPVMGATAFLIAEFLQISYAEVAAAALIPAIVYYLVLFLQVDLIAAKRGLVGVPRAELPKVSHVLLSGWPYIVPFVVLIYLLFWLAYNAGKSALYCAALTLVIGLVATRRWPGPKLLWSIVEGAGRPLVILILICGAAGIVVGVLNLTGLGLLMTNMLSHIGTQWGLLPMLVITALIAIFLGMGMPTAAVYIVLSIILAPALVRMGVEPIAAHMFIFYFGLMSLLTPPVAVASYTAGTLAGAGLWETGAAGMQLAASAFILPFLFCYNPALLAQGSTLEIGLAFATVVAGGYLLAMALTSAGGRSNIVNTIVLLALAGVVSTATIWLGPANPLALLPALLVPTWIMASRRRAAT